MYLLNECKVMFHYPFYFLLILLLHMNRMVTSLKRKDKSFLNIFSLASETFCVHVAHPFFVLGFKFILIAVINDFFIYHIFKKNPVFSSINIAFQYFGHISNKFKHLLKSKSHIQASH